MNNVEDRLRNYKYIQAKINILDLDLQTTKRGSYSFIKLTEYKYRLLTEKELIENAIMKLNENDLFFISLYINTGMSGIDIALLLKKNYNSIRAKKMRILKKLHQELEKDLY